MGNFKVPGHRPLVWALKSIYSFLTYVLISKWMQGMYAAVLINLWESVQLGKNPTRDGKDMFQNNYYFWNRDSIPGLRIQDSARSIRGWCSRTNLTADAKRIAENSDYSGVECTSWTVQLQLRRHVARTVHSKQEQFIQRWTYHIRLTNATLQRHESSIYRMFRLC